MQAAGGGQMTSTPSTPDVEDAQARKLPKLERIGAVLRLPPRERILKTFPCFLVAEILVQGTMVLSEQHLGFFCSLPGLRRSLKIPISEVTSITKEKVFAVFPTGIGIQTESDKFVFSYVTSRDRLLQQLSDHWRGSVAAAAAAAAAPADGGTELSASSRGSASGVAADAETDAGADSDATVEACAVASAGGSDADSGFVANSNDSYASFSHDGDSSAWRLSTPGPGADSAAVASYRRTPDADFCYGLVASCLGLLCNRAVWAAVAVVVSAVLVLALSSRLHSLQLKANAVALRVELPADLQHQQQQQRHQQQLALDLTAVLDSLSQLHNQLRLLRQSLTQLESRKQREQQNDEEEVTLMQQRQRQQRGA